MQLPKVQISRNVRSGIQSEWCHNWHLWVPCKHWCSFHQERIQAFHRLKLSNGFASDIIPFFGQRDHGIFRSLDMLSLKRPRNSLRFCLETWLVLVLGDRTRMVLCNSSGCFGDMIISPLLAWRQCKMLDTQCWRKQVGNPLHASLHFWNTLDRVI